MIMRAPIIVLVLAVAAVLTVMLVTGVADDKAPIGSEGRTPVTGLSVSRS